MNRIVKEQYTEKEIDTMVSYLLDLSNAQDINVSIMERLVCQMQNIAHDQKREKLSVFPIIGRISFYKAQHNVIKLLMKYNEIARGYNSMLDEMHKLSGVILTWYLDNKPQDNQSINYLKQIRNSDIYVRIASETV